MRGIRASDWGLYRAAIFARRGVVQINTEADNFILLFPDTMQAVLVRTATNQYLPWRTHYVLLLQECDSELVRDRALAQARYCRA